MQDLPFDRLGPFPILQFAAAVLVVGGLAIAVWRGMRDRKSSGNIPRDQWLFLDGPIVQHLTMLKEMRGVQFDVRDEMREMNNLLRDIKSSLEVISRTRRF